MMDKEGLSIVHGYTHEILMAIVEMYENGEQKPDSGSLIELMRWIAEKEYSQAQEFASIKEKVKDE